METVRPSSFYKIVLTKHTPFTTRLTNTIWFNVTFLILRINSGVTIGPADPALQGGAVSGGRKIARKCGTFFGKLNCSTSKSTRFRLEMYIFFRFLPSFSLFCRDLIFNETFNKTASRGAKWATGAPAGGRPYPTLRHCWVVDLIESRHQVKEDNINSLVIYC